jgi:hypothetical protein
MDMTKFASLDDPGFKAVAGELRRWAKAIDKQQQRVGQPQEITSRK